MSEAFPVPVEGDLVKEISSALFSSDSKAVGKSSEELGKDYRTNFSGTTSPLFSMSIGSVPLSITDGSSELADSPKSEVSVPAVPAVPVAHVIKAPSSLGKELDVEVVHVEDQEALSSAMFFENLNSDHNVDRGKFRSEALC